MDKYLIKTREEKGITLVALVVTIIILLILAGVAINLTIGDDGIFTRTIDAQDRYKAEEIIEKIELIKANTIIDNKGKFDIDDFFNNLVEEGIVGDREEIIDNGDGSHTITTDEGYVIDIIEKDDGKDVEIEYVGKGEKVGPRIKEIHVRNKTTNAIEIEVEASNANGAKYTYLYKLENKEEYKEAATKIAENTYKYENLEANKIYNIKVEVENKGIKAQKEINVLTGELPEGAISIGEVEWENGKAKVEVNINKEIEGNLKLEYKINEEGSWTEIQDGGIIENLEHNQTVYVRLTDGTNETEYLSTKIEDNIAPEVSIELGTITSNSIQVKVTAQDKETGLLETNTYEYFLNNSSQGASKSNTHTFCNLFDDTSYTLKVVVTDKAGLTNEAEVTGKTNLVPSGTTSGAITFTSPSWSNGTASIQVSTNTSYQIEYQKNSTTGSWTKIASGGTISGLSHNTTVYARLTDGINSGEYASTSIKDTIAPTVSISTSNITTNSVKLTVTASDGQSGLADSGRYTYYLNSTQKASNNTNSYTYTGLIANTSYTLKVAVKDKAGKTTEKSTTIKTSQETVSDSITSGKTYTSNTVIKDSYGNSIKIPAGFKIASDSGKNVTEGVVIEDVSAGDSNTKGNQYVWVPIGNVKYNTSGATKTINFGRYEFETNSSGVMKQSADDYTNIVKVNTGSDYSYTEMTNGEGDNTKAKNLGDFVTKTKNAGGYYIARFEAGKVIGNTNTFNVKKGQTVYTNITQPKAAELAQNLYSSNSNFESDLINSYAWDTAIVFIQTFSSDIDYSKQTALQTTLTTTGNAHDSNNNYDVRCNIYDMAGNIHEWSTESCTMSYKSCVCRGGDYYHSRTCTAYRSYGDKSTDAIYYRFQEHFVRQVKIASAKSASNFHNQI